MFTLFVVYVVGLLVAAFALGVASGISHQHGGASPERLLASLGENAGNSVCFLLLWPVVAVALLSFWIEHLYVTRNDT
jgi:hypothetical protein